MENIILSVVISQFPKRENHHRSFKNAATRTIEERDQFLLERIKAEIVVKHRNPNHMRAKMFDKNNVGNIEIIERDQESAKKYLNDKVGSISSFK